MKSTFKKYLMHFIIFIIVASFFNTVTALAKVESINSKDMIYFLLTDRFYDGDKSNNQNVIKDDLSQYNGGDFQGVIDKLDYIKDLGFTTIWISPVVKNDVGGYHGYWATDFYKTNEHFGTMEKLKELVSKAHDKGIKVIFDLVLNHTGPGHPYVNNPKYPNWFHERKDISDYNNQTEVENGWLAGLPDLNTENPTVKKYLIDMAKWWIKETGIDGYRIDTYRHMPKEFRSEFIKEIKKEYPNFYIVGEVFNGDPDYIANYLDDGISGLLDFPSYYAINDVFKGDKPASYLAEMINREGNIYKDKALMGTFIDNHDVPRFVSQVYRLKDEKLMSALTFMMTYTGIPVMYYGTEIGMDGGTDPDNRGNMSFVVKSPITDYVKKLTNIRKNNSALSQGNIEIVKADDNILCYIRSFEKNTVLVTFNTSEDKQKTNFIIPEKFQVKTESITDSISSTKISVKDRSVSLNMSPLQANIFVLQNETNQNTPKIYFALVGSAVALIGIFLIKLLKK